MIPFFDTQDIVQTVGVEVSILWGIRTRAVFSDDKLEVQV